MEEKIIKYFKTFGIPVGLVFLGVAAAIIIKNYYSVQLSRLNIKLAKNELKKQDESKAGVS